MSSQLWWYLARSSGLVGWALLTASVLWGLGISTRTRPRAVTAGWMLDLHRALGALATIFSVVHVAALVGDSYVHIGPAEIFVPLASAWRPGPVAWGVVGLYLLAAVQLTSMAKRHLPRRVWKLIHLASLPLFVVSTVHAITAGTDTGSVAFVVLAAISVTAVTALTARRIADSSPVVESSTRLAR